MTELYKEKEMDEFLRQSNLIEGVSDDRAFNQAKIAMEWLMKQKLITIPVILHLHKILMLHQNLQPDWKGYLRKIPVYIGGKEAMPAGLVPSSLCYWCRSIKPTSDSMDLHVRYEKIHPFVDGNGRTGRMLLNWIRLKVTNEPLLIIKDSEKQDYYKLFK